MHNRLIIPCILLICCFSGCTGFTESERDALLCHGGGIVSADVELLPPDGRMSLSFDVHSARRLLGIAPDTTGREAEEDSGEVQSPQDSETVAAPGEREISLGRIEVSVKDLVGENGLLPAVLKAANGSAVNLYLNSEWTVTFDEGNRISEYIVMTEDERKSWNELAGGADANGPYQFSIVGRRIGARLQFEISPERAGQTDIRLENSSVPEGRRIEYQLKRSKLDKGSRSRLAVLFFKPGSTGTPDYAKNLEIIGLNGTDEMYLARVRTPGLDLEFGQLRAPLSALLLLTDSTGSVTMRTDCLYLSHNPTAVTYAFVPLFLIYFVVMWIAVKRFCAQENSPVRNLLGESTFSLNPLLFALTPNNRFSISLAQITWWTGIIVFALVYAMFSSFELLDITGQMLILLGISGGTAVLAKAISRAQFTQISPKFMLNVRKDRKPKISDLISIGNAPSVFKFQILAFSIAYGVYALYEMVINSSFPEFSENALLLMGISGGAYIANEISTESVWTDIKKRIEQYDKVRGKQILIYDYIKGRKLIMDELGVKSEDEQPDCIKDAKGKIAARYVELCKVEDTFVEDLKADEDLRARFRIFLEIEELLQGVFDEELHPSMTRQNMARISMIEESRKSPPAGASASAGRARTRRQAGKRKPKKS